MVVGERRHLSRQFWCFADQTGSIDLIDAVHFLEIDDCLAIKCEIGVGNDGYRITPRIVAVFVAGANSYRGTRGLGIGDLYWRKIDRRLPGLRVKFIIRPSPK